MSFQEIIEFLAFDIIQLFDRDEKRNVTETFAHIWAAAHFACMLEAAGIDPPSKLQQTRALPFRRIGDDLCEDRLQFLVLIIAIE